MVIIGCDFHPGFQQIAMFDTETGEIEASAAGAQGGSGAVLWLAARQGGAGGDGSLRVVPSGSSRCWREMGHRVLDRGCGGHPGQLCAEAEDGPAGCRAHSAPCWRQERFPRIWVPTAAERDGRQLIVHRHKRVQMRTRVKNQLQALALNQGLRLKWKLWTQAGRAQLEPLPLLPYAAARRSGSAGQLEELEAEIERLDGLVQEGGRVGERRRAADDPSRSGSGDGAGLCADHRGGGAVRVAASRWPVIWG